MATGVLDSSFDAYVFDETSVKSLVESSSDLNSLPSKFKLDSNETSASSSESLPVIDFSALTSPDPQRRSKAVAELVDACAEWGFFIMVNHGISEKLSGEVFAALKEFFYLPGEVKKQYEPKGISSPIACGNFQVKSTSEQCFTLWRDFLKLHVHPQFHCPNEPPQLRELLVEYTGIARGMARELVGLVSEAIGLERSYVDEVLELDSSTQVVGSSFYPPCPQPDKTIGLPPHNDSGLFTLLFIHNQLPGLQIERHGQWFQVNPPPNSLVVNCGDQLEIFTNGRCKSSNHRAVVNEHNERITIAVGNGPGREVTVGPAAPLVERDGGPRYRSMNYREYVEAQFTQPYNGKTLLQELMISRDDDK